MKAERRALAAAVLLALTASQAFAAPFATPAIVLRPPELWSFPVRSERLLLDLGYAVHYVFESYDEEEISVRALDGRAPIVAGTLRAILHSDPAYASILLRGEETALWIVLNPGAMSAAQMTAQGLKAVDLAPEEVARRVALLAGLLRTIRARLGLEVLGPGAARQVRLELGQVDLLELVPGEDELTRYSLAYPGTSATIETLVTPVRTATWRITWAPPTLTVVISEAGRPDWTVQSLLRQGSRNDPVATTAITVLRRARTRLRTGAVAPPLP